MGPLMAELAEVDAVIAWLAELARTQEAEVVFKLRTFVERIEDDLGPTATAELLEAVGLGG